MTSKAIKKIIIVGGGTAGWITAAALNKAFGQQIQIQLIESSSIGIVGVGEATIPQIRLLNRFIGLDEKAFLAACKGTFKLGIQFNGWTKEDHSYLHAFGDIGAPYGITPFHHYWLRAQQQQLSNDLWSYSLNTMSAMQNRFAPVDKIQGTPLNGINYAFHFDASLYAQHIRQHCEARGVQRIDAKVTEVQQNNETGFIQSLTLDQQQTVSADLFIDCSGFRGILIEQTLATGYIDWRHWLSCDHAVAVQCERKGSLKPYTQSTARTAGWQWNIPLQHRTGNGYVFNSDFIEPEQASNDLLENLEGPAIGDPRVIRFNTGHRRQFWHKNCITIGLSAGFMEPLESTSIHLIQTAVNRLISLFPDVNCDPVLAKHYNQQTQKEYEAVRDFLILHYKANHRSEAFWQQCAQAEIPESLQHKIELFEHRGEVYREADELFTEGSWLQVLWGQGIRPKAYHPLADQLNVAQLSELLGTIRKTIKRTVIQLPTHEEFVNELIKSDQSTAR